MAFLISARSLAAVTFSDGSFNVADWDLTFFTVGCGGSTTSAAQVASGGTPGAYRRVLDVLDASCGSYRDIVGFPRRIGAT